MNFDVYSYAATIIIFCSIALVIYGVGRVLGKRSAFITADDWKSIALTIALFLIVTGPEEYFALQWQTWSYNPARTFDTIFFGAEIETFLFIVLVSLVVSIATIVYARREERKSAEVDSITR